MNRTSWLVSILVCVLAVVAACSRQSSNPSSPSAVNPSNADANADGSTLKATAPTLQSPINGVQLPQGQPVVLVIGNSTATFATGVSLSYRFELSNTAGTVLENVVVAGGSGTTSRTVALDLEGEQTYRWRSRPEYQGTAGPWSGLQTFKAPPNDGFLRGNELYDPLINGKTLGEIHGPVQFIPGVGLKLLSEASYVQYTLPQTLVEGQYSVLVTNMSVISSTEDPKLRIITMREGDAPINDNIYRMSVDKRGNGAIAWRFISGPGPYIETQGAQRQVYSFHEALTYFVEAEWRSGYFNVMFREGGVDGKEIYNFGKPFEGIYQPLPHNVYIGSPYKAGDRGEASSLEDMIIRQIWVSPNPRPSYANK